VLFLILFSPLPTSPNILLCARIFSGADSPGQIPEEVLVYVPFSFSVFAISETLEDGFFFFRVRRRKFSTRDTRDAGSFTIRFSHRFCCSPQRCASFLFSLSDGARDDRPTVPPFFSEDFNLCIDRVVSFPDRLLEVSSLAPSKNTQ